jgi:hypothetical protein
MSENLEIGLNGKDFEVTRHNTSLFTYLGGLAIHDHVFMVIKDNGDGSCEGTHVFKAFLPEAYDALEEHIVEHNFPQHRYLNDVAQIDEDAFQQAVQANAAKDFNDINKWLDEWDQEGDTTGTS